MTDDRRDRARKAHAIFVAALDLEEPDRSRWIDNTCDGDALLHTAVHRLLDAGRSVGGFLETPAIAPDAGFFDATTHAGIPGSPGSPDPRSTTGAPPEAPELIDGYRIIGILGAGGMATVYEAEQRSPRRRVALKVMHRTMARTAAAQRFAFEAQTLARLRHPNIAPIFEAGTYTDALGSSIPYFAMEFVEDARPFTESARDLPLRERLALFADVCDAVRHGHQLGVIHRDLKPGNILVGRDGRPRVIDFGVARTVDPEDTERVTLHTELGQLVGTLNYMSPEQCTGCDRVDTRADVYSLGVVLYELVTGRLPYDLSRLSIPEALRLIGTQSPPRPGSINPAAIGDLDAIITTAMHRDAQHRYQGADALAADIRRFLAFQPVQASLPSPWHAARLFARRHAVLVAFGAILLLTLLVSTGIIGVLGYRAWREADLRIEAERVAIEERNLARRQAYAASIASGFSSYRAREFSQARERLELAPIALRGWEWSLISSLVDRGESIIRAHDDRATMAFAPAARRIATTAADGSAALWDADSHELIARLPPVLPRVDRPVALSPDGRTVFLGLRDGTLLAWRPESGKPPAPFATFDRAIDHLACGSSGVLACTLASGGVVFLDADTAETVSFDLDLSLRYRGAGFSPDGSRVVLWTAGGSLLVLATNDGSTLARLELGVSPEIATISGDNRRLAAGGFEGNFAVWDLESGEPLLETSTAPSISTIRALVFSPDASTLFTGQVDRAILRWSIAGDHPPLPYLGHDETISALAYDGACASLISSSWDGSLRIWPIAPRASSAPMNVIDAHDGNVLSVDFSPSGRLLASGGRSSVVRIWEPTLSLELATLPTHPGAVYAVRFSPDGRWLATGAADGVVRLWSTLSGELVREMPDTGTVVWSIAFTPDGRSLIAAGDSGRVFAWDPETGRTRNTFEANADRIIEIAVSPDGRLLATCGRDAVVRLWNLPGFAPHRTLTGHRSDVFAGVFSGDASILYTGSRDQTVRVWDTRSGDLLDTLSRKGHFITSLSLHPDASRLAAGSWYADVTLFDTQTREAVISFPAQNSAIRSLAFSPNGTMLACSGHDGTVIVYDARPRSELAVIRREALERFEAARSLVESRLEQSAPERPDAESLLRDALAAGPPELEPWIRKALLRVYAAPGDPPPARPLRSEEP